MRRRWSARGLAQRGAAGHSGARAQRQQRGGHVAPLTHTSVTPTPLSRPSQHWDAYSLEDSDGYTRHNFNAIVSNYSFADTYWPAFRAAVVDGGAKGVMCSYNAVNGVPTCASDFLRQVLRGTWGFSGCVWGATGRRAPRAARADSRAARVVRRWAHRSPSPPHTHIHTHLRTRPRRYITSDTGAIEDIYLQHKYVKTEAEAACVAVRNGTTDVCSGFPYHDALLDSVKQGLCAQADVDAALYRTLKLRFELGLFDPVEDQPYWAVPLSAVNSTESQATNWLATLSSMVLLQNNGGVLPLPTGKSVAVIGPHANAQAALVGNYLGQVRACGGEPRAGARRRRPARGGHRVLGA